jgi:hypothetical protein
MFVRLAVLEKSGWDFECGSRGNFFFYLRVGRSSLASITNSGNRHENTRERRFVTTDEYHHEIHRMFPRSYNLAQKFAGPQTLAMGAIGHEPHLATNAGQRLRSGRG